MDVDRAGYTAECLRNPTTASTWGGRDDETLEEAA